MPNTPSASLTHLESAVASLDAKVLDVLTPLGFSDSPRGWSDQLAQIFADRYRCRVADVKDTIRTLAQEFRGTGRTEQLFQEGEDLVQRKDMLLSMFAALDVLISCEFHPPGIQSDRLDRLQAHFPTFRAAVGAISAKTSRWQDDLREWEAVFKTLERPVSTVTLLLHFVPATVPEDRVTEGREAIERLAALWICRRQTLQDAYRLVGQEEPQDPLHLMQSLDEQHEDQPFPINEFLEVVSKLDSFPPLYLPSGYFTASQFLRARATFNRLRSERDAISQDISRLVCIFDHFMSIVDNTVVHMQE